MKVQAHDLSDSPTTPKFSLAQLTVEEFHQFWPQIEQMLDTVPHTWKYWTKDYIVESVERSLLQVWGIGPPPTVTLCFMTQVGVYPTMRVLHLAWAAGHFHPEMLPLMDAALTKYAQIQNCQSIDIRGRPGWHPHLKGLGFTREAHVWSRPVNVMRMN